VIISLRGGSTPLYFFPLLFPDGNIGIAVRPKGGPQGHRDLGNYFLKTSADMLSYMHIIML
jgi:hypothetical protein